MNNVAAAPITPTKPGNPETKILVVEDEPDAKLIFTSLLQMHTNFTVVEASDGSQALSMIEKDHTIKIVLLDIVMPIIDGIEVLKTVKADPEKYGAPKIVMLTNLTSDDSEAKAEEYHADGYLTKINLEPVEFIKEITKYI